MVTKKALSLFPAIPSGYAAGRDTLRGFPKGERLNKRDVNFGLVAEILPLLLVYC
jgi:hypothetical protein